MGVFKSLALALSCFTRLPAPRVDWKPENMRFMMMWLPFIGLLVGAFVALWMLFADAVGLGTVLRAAGIALVPLAVTGGFHMDGLADVVDAQSSHGDPDRKRAILKDPNIGAFAGMAIAAYVLLYFALATELPRAWQVMALIVCLHVMSRSGAGFASAVFWGNGKSGTLTSFRDSADVRVTVAMLVVSFVAAAVAAIVVLPLAGCLMAVVVAGLLAWLNWFARRNFGGMSGDIAGFFVQLSEIVLLASVLCITKAVGL